MNTIPFRGTDFLHWGVAGRAVPGQDVSGDLHLVEPAAAGALVAVVDGLGHGDKATATARAAVTILREDSSRPVVELIQRCHEALVKTRGAVMTLASFNAREQMVSWLSVGNVAGLLLRADAKATPRSESTILRGGVVGYQLPPLHPGLHPVCPGDLLILVSDGIRDGFEQGIIATDAPQQIADRIMGRFFKGTDDALVLVVRYLGSGPDRII